MSYFCTDLFITEQHQLMYKVRETGCTAGENISQTNSLYMRTDAVSSMTHNTWEMFCQP